MEKKKNLFNHKTIDMKTYTVKELIYDLQKLTKEQQNLPIYCDTQDGKHKIESVNFLLDEILLFSWVKADKSLPPKIGGIQTKDLFEMFGKICRDYNEKHLKNKK